MDGRYCNAIVRGGEVELESRQGEPTLVDGADFLKELRLFPKNFEFVFNGELTIDGVSRYESNGIISSIISIQKKIKEGKNPKKDIEKLEDKHMPYETALQSIRFTVWDVIGVNEYFNGKSDVTYDLRLASLKVMLLERHTTMISLIENVEVSSYAEAMKCFQDALKRNEEGTILKSTKGTWKDGKPNWQVKFKKEMNLDLKIVSYNYGTGKNAKLISSINVESSDGLLKTSPTGIKEDMMQYVTDNQEKLSGSILETKCSGISQDEYGNYSVLHPVFKHLRDDKITANSLQECIDIDKASTFL